MHFAMLYLERLMRFVSVRYVLPAVGAPYARFAMSESTTFLYVTKNAPCCGMSATDCASTTFRWG